MAAVFEIFKDNKGEFRFRLKAPNGKIVAQSEGYKIKQNCIKGVDAVKRWSIVAKVVDLTTQYT